MTDSENGAGAHTEADAKDKFREALERKKHKKHPHESASQNESKAHGEHGAAGGNRMFRRKSGG